MLSDEGLKTMVINGFKSGDSISIPLLQRRFRCGYFQAERVLEGLMEEEIVIKEKKGWVLQNYKMEKDGTKI